MARAFPTTSQFITCAGFGVPPSKGTISVWVKPAWNGNDATAHEFYGFGNSAAGFSPSFQKFADNNIYAGFSGSGNGEQRLIIAASALFTSGVWANWVLTYSSTGCILYKNGVSVGSRGATTISGLAAAFRIGKLPSSTVNCNATLAEFAVWNTVLSASEVVAIARGIPPLFTRYPSLLVYVPVIGLGNSEPEWGPSHFTLTPSGSPAFSTHAPVSFWTQSSPTMPTAIPDIPPVPPTSDPYIIGTSMVKKGATIHNQGTTPLLWKGMVQDNLNIIPH